MAILSQSDISRMVVLGNKEVYDTYDKSIPREYPGYTTPKTATKWVEYYDSMGNLAAGYEHFENTKLTYSKVAQAYQTSCTIRIWANGFAHTEVAIASDLFGVINSIKASELAQTMIDLEEERAVYWLNHAFATETLADSVYLCSDTHPCKDASGTYNDTLTTGALSYDNLKAAVRQFVLFKNHAGRPITSTPRRLITHAYNQTEVDEIVGSPNVPHEISNTKNVLPKLTPVYLHYLDSQTAYFLEDPRYEHILFQRLKGYGLQFENAENKVDNPGDIYINARAYYNCCALPNVGIVGSVGT